jgi:GMP synthase-like glutamine amidotransferase
MGKDVRLLVLEHEEEAPAALLEEWARSRGISTLTLRVPELELLPPGQDGDVIVSLGSDASVHASEDPWIEREVRYLRASHDAGVPILGICFGAQALARALGGEVSRAPRLSPEWTSVDSPDPELIPPGPWFRWHEDVFTVPPGARELGRVGDVPLVFAHGRSIGVQFHPEVTGEIAKGWIEGARRELADSAIDEDELRREIDSLAAGATVRAQDLFDRIAARWAAESRSPA